MLEYFLRQRQFISIATLHKKGFDVNLRIAKNNTDTLLLFSVAYLLLPNLIFLLFWFKWWITSVVLSLLGLVVYKHLKYLGFNLKHLVNGFLKDRSNLLLLLTAFLVCLLTGVGLFLPQGDLPKHHAVLKILVESPWPVSIIDQGEKLYLVYYFAWYLPAALLGKILGLQAALVFLFFESFLGLHLVLCWLVRLTKSNKSLLLPLTIFFLLDGQDSIFILLKHAFHFLFDVEGSRNLLKELMWQMSYYDFTLRKFSAAFDLTFVPQQALGAWLATALMVNSIYKKDNSLSVLVLSLSALWSALGTIGLLPIFLYSVVSQKLKGVFSTTNLLLGVPIGLLVLIYFQSHLPIYEQGWIWQHNPAKHWFLRWLSFIVFEFGLYAFLMAKPLKSHPLFKLWIICNISLFAMSLFVFGLYNDLLMRASMPLHFIFVLATVAFYHRLRHRFKKHLLILLLATSSCSFFLVIAHLHHSKWQTGLPKIEESTLFQDMEKKHWFHRQYLGESDSFYGKYLSRDSDCN